MISTSKKHELLLKYSQKRDAKYEDFMVTKCGSKEAFMKTTEGMTPYQKATDTDYTHLYKKFADDHKNKDV